MHLPVRVCLILIIQSDITQSTKLFPLLKDLGCSEKNGKYHLKSKNISEIRAFAFRLCKTVFKVYLQENIISKISPIAFEGTQIAGLYLTMNRLTCIPDLHSIAKTLGSLIMEHNRLGQCQKQALDCKEKTFEHLRYLYLAYNELTQLPWIVFCTKGLQYLGLQGNRFQTSPDLF